MNGLSHHMDTVPHDEYNIPYGNNPPRISQYFNERSRSQAPEVSIILGCLCICVESGFSHSPTWLSQSLQHLMKC